MIDLAAPWKARVAGVLNELLRGAGLENVLEARDSVAEDPPQKEFGDLGFPMFGYAKLLRRGPPEIARRLAERLGAEGGGSCNARGPYLNVFLDRGEAAGHILSQVLEGADFGQPRNLEGRRIMIEFSSPNTNKPLHLGHLRNDVLGESISRILKASGADLRKVCIINNRGIHICKSMLSYREHGEGRTPESENIKSDHFVGNWYVRYSQDLKAEAELIVKEKGVDRKKAEAETALQGRAQELLRLWEAGDAETVKLWETMNGWTVKGMKETWERTGISFDQFYFESETYLLGRDEVLKGLEKGLFYRAEDGAVMVDLSAEKLDQKALLRSDGTSIYITQDIGTAIHRHEDWPFDRLVYVVGSEQQYHFQVLFSSLRRLGFEWAKDLYHLSYGMVNLPEGKMKSREGTVVDADDLIDSLRDDALLEIREKDREEAVGDPAEVAEKIALGALHYYLLQVSPQKDMLFDPKESLSFTGNTGPYLQYMGARISALLRKAGETSPAEKNPRETGAFLSGDAEWDLLKALAGYEDAVAESASHMDPSILTGYLYELSRLFSRFYHDCPILAAESPELKFARLDLCRAADRVLREAFNLICIPFLETM
jgi:arginyl-tRNA synthetase